MNLNACSAMVSAQNVLDMTMVSVKLVLMGTTYQEQLATNVMLNVPPALVEPQVNAQDATKDISWM